jgi:alpha-N-arabinofuranosidase
MKLLTVLFAPALLAVSIAAFGQNTESAAPKQIEATIDISQTSAPISKYEHGMFIEHIGMLIYRSLWSEMLDDRKFYFPISSKEPEAAARAQGGPFRGMQVRKWRPVGPDDAVTLDKDHSFVGEQSPRITLNATQEHGIQQSGIALVKGKAYKGHIVLRGTPGARVKVLLSWGDLASDRQAVSLPALTAAYKTYPLSFLVKGDTESGALAIIGTGSGDFHVGTVSLMPADNVEGFRPDTIALLKELHSGFWRLPGGNFISDFSWYDSIGDRDKRPPVFDYAWNAMQTNDVGMDEFMTLCRLLAVDAYITVNAGFGDAHSAAEEVEYMNGSVNTRMGALRAKNGHVEPYHVKFWDIGNEPYGTWQLGRTDLKYYVLKHNEFAKAMRQADPSITLLASGAMPDEMTIEGMTRALHLDNLQAQFGSEADWTGGLLAKCWGNFEGITEHWYSRAGYRFDITRAKDAPVKQGVEPGYVPADETTLEWVRHPSNRVHLKAEEWNEYEKRFPEMNEKKIFLSIDEYAYTAGQANLKLALAYAMVFNEMIRHTDFLKMSAFTMGISTLDFNQTASTLNTNGLLFKLYGDHFGSIPVAVSGNSPQPAPKYPPGGDQPKTNAGSPTYPLDMVAALTADRKFLTIAVANATDSAQPLALEVNGAHLAGPATLWQMTGPTLDAANHVGQAAQVEVKEMSIGDAPHALTVAPISVNIYRIPVAP